MKKGLLKRFLAGFMAFALLFMSVDSGCITAIAADLKQKTIDMQYKTGRIDVNMVPISLDKSGEIGLYNYVKHEGNHYGSAYYDNEWEKYSSYYYYNLLPDEYKAAWDALNDLCLSYLVTNVDASLIQFSDGTSGYYTAQISMPEGCTKEDLETFYTLFVMSNPQYYFVASGMLYAEDFSSIGLQVYDSLVLGTKRAEVTELFKAKIDLAIAHINQGTSPEEKLLLAHDYIVENVEYNDEILEGDNYIDYDEEQAAYSQSAYSALCLGLTVCAGYSEAMQLLCNSIGIDALCVTSYNHQWNKVRMNDSWYNVDVTWADSEYDDGTKVTWYEYYARNDETYGTHPSHVMEAMWDEFAPECTIDVVPTDATQSPGTFPTVNETVATPVVSMVQSGLDYVVTITTSTENATIYYTVDGTNPAAAASKSYKYDGEFTVSEDTAVKAIAVRNTYLDSAIVEKNTITLQDVTISDIGSYSYTGSPLEPELKIYNAKHELLVKGTDYIVEYTNNTNVGTAVVEIVFIGEYSAWGAETRNFEIVPADITEAVVDVDGILSKYEYNDGIEIVFDPSEIVVTWDGQTLQFGRDYTLGYSMNREVGTATYFIEFLDNYTGKITGHFEIVPKEVDTENVEISGIEESVEYSGAQIDFSDIVVKLDGKILVFETDYMITVAENSASNGKDVGIVTLLITFVGNYSGFMTVTYEIVPTQVEASVIGVQDKHEGYEYTGQAITPDITVTVDGKEVTYYRIELVSANVNVGTVTYKVILTGNYTGEVVKTFEITPMPADKLEFELEKQTYNGQELTPNVIVTYGDVVLELGKDYVLEFDEEQEEIVNAGSYPVKVVLKGNYSGTKELTFVVEPKSGVDLEISEIDDSQYIYTGEEYKPEVVIKDGDVILVEGTDYTVSYSNNTNAGEANITIAYKNNYSGSTSIAFNITPVEAEIESVTDSEGNEIESFIYTGSPIVPELIVGVNGLLQGDVPEYKIEFLPKEGEEVADNTNAGEVTYKVVLTGNYSGEYIGTFTIVPVDSEELQMATMFEDQPYTGEAITLSIVIGYGKIRLVEGVDFDVTYENNIEIGTAKATISFKGNYMGENKVIEFQIVEPEPEDITSTSDQVDINTETGIISKLTAGTTVEAFVGMLADNASVQVVLNGEVVSKEALLGTGMVVQVLKGNEVVKEYTIVVSGDVNGDGKINARDYALIKSHILKVTGVSLTDAQLKGADVFGTEEGYGDGKVNARDYALIKSHILKILNLTSVIAK